MTTPDPERSQRDPDAKVAPETLELRARPQPVTRINRKVLIGGAAVLLFLISGIVLVALKPPSLRIAGPQELFNVDHKPITDGLSKLPATYDGVRGDKKIDAPKLTQGRAGADGGARSAMRSPRPSASRRRASPAWPARRAKSQVFFRLQLKAPPREAPAAEARPDPIPRPSPTAADGDLTTLSALRAAERARALRPAISTCWRTTPPSRRASSPS